MHSNVINLSDKLADRDDKHILTPKQQLTVELHNNYIKQKQLTRAIRYHKVAQKRRIQKYNELSSHIELQKEKLLELN
jgi:hypothetical protein